ncbi:hypothetical protein SRRS_53740 [Sporomusa rhizae]|uniref:Ig-like domain-containing protein n=1 Tax=Sporomusa rhizae TaxID=357999 RepID=UPI00352BB5D7
MATVGQKLTAPEAGWKRINLTLDNVSYGGGTDSYKYGANTAYLGDTLRLNVKGAWVKLNFNGDRIRIIGTSSDGYDTSIKINIDGEDFTFSERTGAFIWQALVFEKTGMSNSEHTVTITRISEYKGDNLQVHIDAIDIDENGEFLPYNPSPVPVPTNLTVTAGDAKVTLNWNAVTGVTGYNVKRATTAGGPYTTIASNVSGTSYVDSAITNGTTYYYVVTAITANGESGNSNKASATPTAPPDPKLHIVLEVGEQIQLIGNILPEIIGDPNLEWNSAFPNIASVDATGKVTAHAEGVTRIQVKTVDGTWTDYALVEVIAKEYRLSILLKVGESCLLKFAADKDVIWQSGDSAVATVDPSNAPITRVTARAGGLSLVTVKTADGSKRDQIYVTVIK